VLREECKDGGGVASGDCAPFPADRPVAISAATCCVCTYYFDIAYFIEYSHNELSLISKLDQQKCNSATSQNNTYFSSDGYPGSFEGGKK
jgi:hypothetical protein